MLHLQSQGRDEEEGVATVRRPHGRRGPQVDHREDGADVKQDLQILQVSFAEWVRCKETCGPTQ